MAKKKRKKPGPKPVTVKIEGDWKDALRRVLHMKRPKEWPQVPDDEQVEPEDSENDTNGQRP